MSSIDGLVADVVPSSYVDGPGNRYVVFLQGCTFNCLACHNPQTIACWPNGSTRVMSVDELVDDISREAPFLSGVTVSGGEATLQWEFVQALFGALTARDDTARLSRLIDTNGDADREVWDALSPSMDGAMVDLKALDPEVHRYLTGRDHDRVLASLRHLASIGRLSEVRLLIVPGVNDTQAQLAATARFLVELDALVPTGGARPTVAVLGFRSEGVRRVASVFRDATPADLEPVVAALTDAGIDAARIRTWPTVEDSLPTDGPTAS
jgi:pyruvate formate lyase activating enzyme